MTNDNQDALRCAAFIRRIDTFFTIYQRNEVFAAANHLQRLVADNEAKDALLRQAVEALEQAKQNTTHGQIAWNCKEAIAAIRQHLDQKTT